MIYLSHFLHNNRTPKSYNLAVIVNFITIVTLSCVKEPGFVYTARKHYYQAYDFTHFYKNQICHESFKVTIANGMTYITRKRGLLDHTDISTYIFRCLKKSLSFVLYIILK